MFKKVIAGAVSAMTLACSGEALALEAIQFQFDGIVGGPTYWFERSGPGVVGNFLAAKYGDFVATEVGKLSYYQDGIYIGAGHHGVGNFDGSAGWHFLNFSSSILFQFTGFSDGLNVVGPVVPYHSHVQALDRTYSRQTFEFPYMATLTISYLSDFTPPQAQVGIPAPEPATWAMMLTGFFGIGSLLRRRRGQPALASAAA